MPVRLSVDKNNNLEESTLHLEILQEYSTGARGERIILGAVKLNLAEYTEPADSDGDEGIVRRYLMRDSKINSTLKVFSLLGITTRKREALKLTARRSAYI